jgi:hypothetical protein
MNKNIFLTSLMFLSVTCCNLNAHEEHFQVPYEQNDTEEDCQKEALWQRILTFSGKRSKSNSLRMTKSSHINTALLEEESVCYLEGYIQALIDANYYENYVVVYVDKDKVVYLYNLPSDQRLKNSIIAFVKDLPGIKDVQEREIDQSAAEKVRSRRVKFHVSGVWFPESTVLFSPLIANPRDPVYSIAYRGGDEVIANEQIAISLGDIFPLYRFFNIWGGDLQIDIGACMWANFNMKPVKTPANEFAELVTTDYILSIPISYARNNLSYRLRIYHISSHLGDEFMVNQPQVARVNPSFEAIDFFASYQFEESLRFYAGPGFILNFDPSFPMKYVYLEYGFEFKPLVRKYNHPKLYGGPFLAVDVQQWQLHDFRPSLTLQLGYLWSKFERAGRNLRLFFEYHNGYSEGQFFDQVTEYWAIRAAWGF